MKTIKIAFMSLGTGVNPNDFFITNILRQYYQVEIMDKPEDAEYIICGAMGKYQYVGYPQIRIMYSGENYIPDFNLIDYGISLYPVDFLDRHLYLPCFTNCVSFDQLEKLRKNRTYMGSEELKNKCYFANMIVGHESENHTRGDFFKALSKYKRVESPGTFLNNMPNGETVALLDGSKMDFLKKCKFTICFESTSHEGFITEKIVDAFIADTIPIYWGSPTVSDIYNPDAFIDCNKFPDFDSVIERIIDLDKNDDKYLEMLRKPILRDNNLYEIKYNELVAFLRHIFDQPLELAYRRSRVYWPGYHEGYLTFLQKTCANALDKQKKKSSRATRFVYLKNDFINVKNKTNYARAILFYIKELPKTIWGDMG